jgi:outer membrane protein assembly factor BamD
MKRSLAVLLLLVISGCGILPDTHDETRDWSAQKLYTSARDEMTDGNYEKAIKHFESLEARYPYGRFAQQAQLEVAYAYYKASEPVSAIAACDRFIKLHPNHPNVDYVYYLKGLSNFNEDIGMLSNIADQDMTERDPKAARESFDSFKELVTRFPDSKYAPDAAARMNYLVNALASHDVHVARYYMKRGAYVAAVNRAQDAVVGFPQAPAKEEAMAIMVRAYEGMGATVLRDDALRVLKLNFPNSKYLGNFEQPKAWWKLW